MQRKALLYLLLILAFLLFSKPILAQDPGEPDTVRVGSIQVDPQATPVTFMIPVTLFNDEELHAGSFGLFYDSEDITIDSIIMSGGVAYSSNPKGQPHADSLYLFVGFVHLPIISGSQPVPPGDGLLAELWFTLDANAPDQTIIIDSGFVPPAVDFIVTLQDGTSITPQYIAGVITVGEGDPPEPVIGLDPTAINFTAFAGGSNPTSQILNITNEADGVLSWTASWNSSWLTFFPFSGTAPSSPTVGATIFGMPAGIYYDTITITGVNAVNSPQLVPVTLTLEIPPPTIELVPDNFYFAAQQDDVNPPNQQMTINDVGGGTLSWTAANSQSWLTLSGYSGGPDETIDLMIDITGLVYGMYYDTIIVSDPAANNTPQKAEVVLEIVSSFPVLAVAPDSFVVASSTTTPPTDRILEVINTGGGTMNFEVTSSKPWMSFTPQSGSSGSSVQEVLVSFNPDGLSLGYHYDTIVVNSDNASESPQSVPVLLWIMNNPPELQVSTDQLIFSGYECDNIPAIPAQSFTITNPSDDNLNWVAEWNADWMEVDPDHAPDAATVTVTVDETGLAPGIYTDTIIINPLWASNLEAEIEVIFTVEEQTLPPELVLSTDSLGFIFLAGQLGLVSYTNLQITNGISGCMDWYISDPYPWLSFTPESGSKPGAVSTIVNSNDLPNGITTGSFTVVAPGSTNGSIDVDITVYIAQFGDANCDGKVNLMDAVWIINYVFSNGPTPIPRVWTGDCNCDKKANVQDAVWIINYVFSNGAPPCQYVPIILP